MSIGYVGLDRRQPLVGELRPRLQRRVSALAAAAIVGWCVIVAICARWWPVVDVQLRADARVCSAALFLIAGVLRLARWRLTGEAPVAYAAAAWTALGGCSIVLGFFGPILQSSERFPSAPAVKIVILLPVFLLLEQARRSPQVRAGVRPGLLAGAIMIGCFVALLVLAMTPLGRGRWLASPVFWASAECAAAWPWALLAAAGWRRAGLWSRTTVRWVAVAMMLLSAAEALRGISIVVPGSLLGQASGFALVAAGLLVTASAVELWDVYSVHGTRERSLAGGLDQVSDQLRLVRQEQQERLHDARSAVFGVLGASRLLSDPAAEVARDSLRRLMQAELDRLSQVLDPDSPDPVEVFALDAVAEPVLLASAAAGVAVQATGLSVLVRGRRQATATVLANLLGNAAKHAPGAQVQVSARVAGAYAVIVVQDDGPGIPSAELDRVLLREQRGSLAQASGSGLGLYLASLSMQRQGGTLRLASWPSGGLRVELTMPLAAIDRSAELRAC